MVIVLHGDEWGNLHVQCISVFYHSLLMMNTTLSVNNVLDDILDNIYKDLGSPDRGRERE